MIEIPVSIGEVFDKITILQIKLIEIKEESKKKNIQKELNLLLERIKNIEVPVDLLDQLKFANLKLWHIENRIRIYEQNQNFDLSFIELARSVYTVNDIRAELKKKINEKTNSELIEEKSYQ